MRSEPEQEGGTPSPSPGDPILEAILDEYLTEAAAGRAPDPDRYVAAHPERAEALRGIFRTLAFVEASGAARRPSPLEAGRRFGEYEVVRELARGGMGVVYEAVQTSLGRRVALKVLPECAFLGENALARFRREAAAAAQLHHTNIVPVYAVGEEQGVHYFAMQYIEGASLAALLKRWRAEGAPGNGSRIRRVADWGRQAAGALAHAHEAGTIHRDIKPSNLLRDDKDHVWITDFGLARTSAEATITAAGDVLGTARYMSPEQARGDRRELDARTDIYSLGATLYELLALTPAVEGESREEVLSRIAFATPVPLRRRDPRIPRDLATIVARCMEKEPRHRYASASAVAEDLRRFLAHEPIRARRPSVLLRTTRWVQRHRALTGAAALVLVLAVATIALAIDRRRTEGERRLELAFNAILYERDFVRGAELLDEAAARGVDSSTLHLYRGLLQLANRRGIPALAPLREALERDPARAESRLALALAHTLDGDFAAGMRLLEAVPEAEIDTALGWFFHGNMLGLTQHSRALASYDRAIALRPDFVPAIAARGHYLGFRLLTEGRAEDLEPMLADGQALVVFRPGSARSWAVRGGCWLAAAAYAGTRDHLRPRRAEWLANARADLERAVALSRPDDPLSLVAQGMFLRYVGEYAAAEAAFRAARAADAASPWGGDQAIAGEHVAMLWILGRLDEALAVAEEAHRLTPTFYPVAVERALVLAETGRVPEAQAAASELARHHRMHANALFFAVALLELLGSPAEAASALTELESAGAEAIRAEDTDEVYTELASALLAGEGEELLAAAADRPGTRCELSFLLGLRRLGRGDRDGGLAALRTCLATEVFRFLEHRLAQVLLARAAADAGWPAWRAAPR
ncbi:MAG: protein kinase [Planctomycetota bacterium]